MKTQTALINGEWHLTTLYPKNDNGGKSILAKCGLIDETTTEPKLFDLDKQAPTCPDCLQIFFNSWPGMSSVRKRCDKAVSDRNKMLGGLDRLIQRQRDENMRAMKKSAYDEGSFPFIPFGTAHLFHQMTQVGAFARKCKDWSGYYKSKSMFLDAGCGIGNVMLMASIEGFCSDYHGLEYFPETVKRAKTFLAVNPNKKFSRFKVFKSDILKFRKYGDYDVIYFYCPFTDRRLQTLFEERLENQMQVGAILIANLKKSKAIKKDDRFEKLSIPASDHFGPSGVYMKVKGGKRPTSDLFKEEFTPGDVRGARIQEKYKL